MCQLQKDVGKNSGLNIKWSLDLRWRKCFQLPEVPSTKKSKPLFPTPKICLLTISLCHLNFLKYDLVHTSLMTLLYRSPFLSITVSCFHQYEVIWVLQHNMYSLTLSGNSDTFLYPRLRANSNTDLGTKSCQISFIINFSGKILCVFSEILTLLLPTSVWNLYS